ELVEAVQIRPWDLDPGNRSGAAEHGRRTSGFGTARGQRPRPRHDRLGRADVFASAFVNRLLDARLGVLAQELEHADELTGAGQRAVALFQLGPEREEGGGQVPVAVDR